MKIINLSNVLAILLFTSATPVLAMDDTDKMTSTPKVFAKFPLKEAGERIAAQPYSITGEEIKHLITSSAQKNSNPLTDKRTTIGSGVWVTNLSDYEKIKNEDIYTMSVGAYQVSSETLYDWKAKGTVPGTQKEFLLSINSNYDPFHFGFPRVY